MELEPAENPRTDAEDVLALPFRKLSISADPLTTADPLSCSGLESLQDLAARGSWSALLEMASQSISNLRNPHERLVYMTFQTLALSKLRRFSDALNLIISDPDLDLDSDVSSPRYLYESYPNLYPNLRGSMVPFALRFLHADLPHRLGRRSETLERLYSLLDFVRRKSTDEKCGESWRKRESFLISSIIGHHLSQKEFDPCLKLIRHLLRSDSENPILLSRLGYILMHVGDLCGARAVFDRIDGLKREDKNFKNLVNRNRALVYIIEKDYVSAVKEYEECIERDPMDIVAINNKALCLMHMRNLSDSIKVLEDALERAPTAALNETVVVNLCSMYELAYVNHAEIKKTLRTWIARVAPDDFDSSCTRI